MPGLTQTWSDSASPVLCLLAQPATYKPDFSLSEHNCLNIVYRLKDSFLQIIRERLGWTRGLHWALQLRQHQHCQISNFNNLIVVESPSVFRERKHQHRQPPIDKNHIDPPRTFTSTSAISDW